MRISSCIFSVALALSAGAAATVLARAARPSVSTTHDKGRLLVQEQARGVQSLREFEVSHQVDITSVTPRYNATTHQYLKTWIKRPHLIRVQVQAMAHGETLVSDGVGTWIYRDADRQYWRQPGPPPSALFSNAFPGLARELSDVDLPKIMTDARVTGEEALRVDARSFPCDIVDVTLSPAATRGAIQNNSIQMWISRQYHVPLKVQATFLGTNGAGNKTYTDYVTTFLPEAHIPSSAWVFVPPKDSRPATDTKAPPVR